VLVIYPVFVHFRLRCICMAIVVAVGAVVWQNRQFLSTYTGFVLHSPAAESETWQYDAAVLPLSSPFLSAWCHV